MCIIHEGRGEFGGKKKKALQEKSTKQDTSYHQAIQSIYAV